MQIRHFHRFRHNAPFLMEKKNDKEKSHKGIWWSECPGSVPEINLGRPRVVMGKSLDSLENGNVDKMSEKYPKNVRKMSKNCLEGLKTQFSDIFWTIFAYSVDAFVW